MALPPSEGFKLFVLINYTELTGNVTNKAICMWIKVLKKYTHAQLHLTIKCSDVMMIIVLYCTVLYTSRCHQLAACIDQNDMVM